MKTIKEGTQFSSFAELATAMGVKVHKVNNEKLKAQQEKLCKCYKCGGQMQYINGSNILTCHNTIERNNKKKECGNTRMLNESTAKYAQSLFV